MKSRFFYKKDEIVLSTVTALVVTGLLYQGFTSLFNTKEHSIFQKNPMSISKK